LTLGYQAYVKNITIDGMTIFIEGNEDSITGDMSVNMDLLCKDMNNLDKGNIFKNIKKYKKKNGKSTWMTSGGNTVNDWEVVKSINSPIKNDNNNNNNNNNIVSASNVTSVNSAIVVNATPVKITKIEPTPPSSPSTPSIFNFGQQNKLFNNITGALGNLIKEVDDHGGFESYVQKKSDDFTKSIADGSLLQNAKKSIDEAFNNAKRCVLLT
jgi:hypothetical protein